jgi:hypothetical protein
MRPFALFAVACALAGCRQICPGAGISEMQFNQDSYECAKESSAHQSVLVSGTWVSTGRDEELFRACMLAHGHTAKRGTCDLGW